METILMEGALSVKSCVKNHRRTVMEVMIEDGKKSKDVGYILGLCRENNIKVVFAKREEIDLKASGKTHGGILAVCGKRIYQSIDELNARKVPFYAIVEGVEDPFNLGYMIRTLSAAGCDGLFLNNRDWSMAESVIMKSSAGTFDALPIHLMANPAADLIELRKREVRIVSAVRSNRAVSMEHGDFNQALALAIGGEMRGLSTVVLEASDAEVFIPYPSTTKVSLNAASAAAVLAFEVVRQRKNA